MHKYTHVLVYGSVALAMISAGCRRAPRAQKSDQAQTRAVSDTKPPQASEPGPGLLKTSEIVVSDRLYRDRLLRGFYGGTEGWKWTSRECAVSLDVPPPLDAPTELEVDFNITTELITAVHEVTLTVRVNGGEVGKEKYTGEGRHNPTYPIPAALLKQNPAVVEFQLDRWGRDPQSGRDIGLILVALSLKHPETAVMSHDTASELAQRGYAQLLQRRQLQIPQAQQNEMMKLFHKIPVWRHMWFHNVPIGKNPLDLWMMQQIIYEIQPEFIVETGTFMGGSALYFAHTLNGMGLENSRVITVDISDLTSTAAKHPLWKYVTFLKGSSTDPAIVAQIAQRVKGHKTLVTLDSDHSMQHVLNEMRAYSPMVSRGSYLIVEDTNLDGVPIFPEGGPGPMAAVLQFFKDGGNKTFTQDLSREAFIMTFNPGGWLRRK